MTPTLRFTAATLRVADLGRCRAFYEEQLGFVAVRADAAHVVLAVSPDAAPILTLVAAPGAPRPAPEAAGLFHLALLLPDRGALGAWLARAGEKGVEFDGFSDHGVSEALYLSDPEGNGLEFYADRPSADWPRADGGVAMTTLPLDVRGLLAAARTRPSLLAGAAWGHLHLRVTDLARSEAFYLPTLGMAVMQRSIPGARFLAADGYHHHVALNTWGRPRQPQPPGALGLAEATFARAGTAAATTVADPDGIALRIVPLGATAP